jgi:hypothetical protein
MGMKPPPFLWILLLGLQVASNENQIHSQQLRPTLRTSAECNPIPSARSETILLLETLRARMPPPEALEGPCMFFMDGYIEGLPGVWEGSTKAKVVGAWGMPSRVVPARHNDEGILEEQECWVWLKEGYTNGSRLYFDPQGRACVSVESKRSRTQADKMLEHFLATRDDWLESLSGWDLRSSGPAWETPTSVEFTGGVEEFDLGATSRPEAIAPFRISRTPQQAADRAEFLREIGVQKREIYAEVRSNLGLASTTLLGSIDYQLLNQETRKAFEKRGLSKEIAARESEIREQARNLRVGMSVPEVIAVMGLPNLARAIVNESPGLRVQGTIPMDRLSDYETRELQLIYWPFPWPPDDRPPSYRSHQEYMLPYRETVMFFDAQGRLSLWGE